MFVVIKETKDANGEPQGKKYYDFVTESEAKEEYERVILESNVTYASYGRIEFLGLEKYYEPSR